MGINTVSVMYYPFAKIPHSELRSGNDTYYIGICRDGVKTLENFNERAGRAKTNGSPFIEFNVNVTPEQATKIDTFIHQKSEGGETSCMRSVSVVLRDQAGLVIPSPASYCPFSAAVCLAGKYAYGKLPFTKPEITKIRMVGEIPSSSAMLYGIGNMALESVTVLPITVGLKALELPVKGIVKVSSTLYNMASYVIQPMIRKLKAQEPSPSLPPLHNDLYSEI